MIFTNYMEESNIMTNETKKKACVLGAGNSAHVTAGLVASLPDWECHVYAPRKNRAELWKEGIAKGGMKVQYGSLEGNVLIQGAPVKISKYPEDVIPGCQVLIMCLPATAFEENIIDVAPYVDEGAMIGTICASNGYNWCIDYGMNKAGRDRDSYGVFALQNLPWACRYSEYGVSVEVLGTKPFMEIVARPRTRLEEIGEIMSKLIYVKCPPVHGGFIGAGLSNMTQVIHPAIMHDNFKDWDGKTPYKENPLFYQGLSEEAADNMLKVSDEIMAVKAEIEKRVPHIDLEIVHHVTDWIIRAYEKHIADKSSLRAMFASLRAYEGLTCPMIEVEGGLIPDFTHRYLTEDIPFNFTPTKGIAELCGIETPTIDKILDWGQKAINKEFIINGKLCGKDLNDTFAPQRFGFTKLEDIPEIIFHLNH